MGMMFRYATEATRLQLIKTLKQSDAISPEIQLGIKTWHEFFYLCVELFVYLLKNSHSKLLMEIMDFTSKLEYLLVMRNIAPLTNFIS